MQAIERNLARHGNGTIYLIVRRNGRLHRLSLKTKDLNFARQLLREVGIERLLERTSLALNPVRQEARVLSLRISLTKNGEERTTIPGRVVAQWDKDDSENQGGPSWPRHDGRDAARAGIFA